MSNNNNLNERRSLPRFGEWDVNDPASGDGFTVIFNKARDERASKKHDSSSQTFRRVQTRTNSKTPPKPQTRKWLCCIFQPDAES